MLVPAFWAVARLQQWHGKRQITVHRWGWSDSSEADAQTMADARAAQAMADLQAGHTVARRERKQAYNGAQGLPIREEVLARHGSTVITRNAYGAHCLNTPDVVFADVDFATQAPARLGWVLFALLALAIVGTARTSLGGWVWPLAVLAGGLASAPAAQALYRLWIGYQGGHEALARKKVQAFVAQHPNWNVRLYRTPAGLRLLVTHAVAEPTDRLVQAFFEQVQADAMYVRMCNNQHCFRARVTGKPWRMGIDSPMRPRPGVWPVRAEAMPQRTVWTQAYDQKAQAYAACRWLGDVGSGTVHPQVQPVVALHDELSRAQQPGLPLA